jgi:hypothetical protein
MAYANHDAVTQIANGLSTTTFTYDNKGNVTQKTTDGTTTTYVYDYANRLIALGVDGATTSYGYDWAGNRVYQTGTTTTYLYPFKWRSVASSTGTGAKFATTTDYVFNGDSLVATVDQPTASGNATGTAKTPPSGPGCSIRFEMPSLPRGYRPRGAAAPAATSRPQLDRDPTPQNGLRDCPGSAAAMPMECAQFHPKLAQKYVTQ